MADTKKARVARQKTRQLDETLSDLRIPPRPRNGWIVAMREGLGMTQTQLAHRLGVKRQSVDQLARNEVTGAATLAALQRAAEALGCELQYVLVPKISVARMIEHQALKRALHKLGRANESQALEASALDPDAFSSAVKDLAKEMEVQRTNDLWND